MKLVVKAEPYQLVYMRNKLGGLDLFALWHINHIKWSQEIFDSDSSSLVALFKSTILTMG